MILKSLLKSGNLSPQRLIINEYLSFSIGDLIRIMCILKVSLTTHILLGLGSFQESYDLLLVSYGLILLT